MVVTAGTPISQVRKQAQRAVICPKAHSPGGKPGISSVAVGLQSLLPAQLWVCTVPAAPDGDARNRPRCRSEGGRSGEAVGLAGQQQVELNRVIWGVRNGQRHLCAGPRDRNSVPTGYVGTTTLENKLAASVKLKMVCPFTWQVPG